MAKKPNRLINEKSPYLRQHAYNPVDWYPWSEEAFEKAKKEDKPVFLSIGYSTCHWCHVMEKESFEDEEIAQILNKYFVPIKVDREERPDIDSIYMNVCMMMTGHGGWPLTVFLTPDKKPFYAGTYFPKESTYTRIGLKDLLLKLAQMWKEDRETLLNRSEKVLEYLKELTEKTATETLSSHVFDMSYERFKDIFDPYYGGFGHRPKFPSPHNFLFLLRYYHKTKKENALEMVKHTLKNMRLGGIFDHVGFGFHRYSTDERWLLPHFEKMLYDQAMLTMAYLETYQITKDNFYKQVAEEILEYVKRDMTSSEGGFYSAEDADSEGEEGKFYVWEYDELKEILKEDFELFIKIFNIQKEGNFREEATGKITGKNIIYMKRPVKEIAEKLGKSEEEIKEFIEKTRKKLFDVRKKRIHPLKDTKILTDWNGLMIAAFSMAYQITEKEEYLETAKKAADFILEKMKKEDGTLLHRYKDGEAKFNGNFEDYAFLVWGLIELYYASFEEKYLKEAVKFTDKMIQHFWDKENGGFFMTPDLGEKLIVRPKESYDGAIPSGNSVAAYNLFRLYRITGNKKYEGYGLKTVNAFANKIKTLLTSYSMMLVAYDFYLSEGIEIVLAGKKEKLKAFISKIYERFLPYKTVVLKENEKIAEIVPYVKDIPVKENPEAYICKNFSCQMPITDIKTFEKELG
ncbi:MAG: thioredoxin domain-containing protein [Aquificae bacterium]|nr:thioredoxin domain-containing protein [Aquificota bacterium]